MFYKQTITKGFEGKELVDMEALKKLVYQGLLMMDYL